MGFKKFAIALAAFGAAGFASADISRPPNFHKRAAKNADAAHVAFNKSYQVLKNWESVIDKKTGLIPKGLNKKELNRWVPKDTAGDNFAHLLIASLTLNPQNSDKWSSMIRKERSICGPMPCQIDLETGELIIESEEDRIFGAAEYGKDGLLSVVERFGDGPWLDRLIELTDAVLDQSTISTKRGPIPSQNLEANGDMLQILSRLWWRTKNDRYLIMAERIADVYLFDVLPINNNALPYVWNFKTNSAIDNRTILRDHGNEFLVGLSELYFLEKMSQRKKANTYSKALHSLFTYTAELGRDKTGLWHCYVNPVTKKPVKDMLNDNWGYVLNSYVTLNLIKNNLFYEKVIQESIEAILDSRWINWGWDGYDSLADSIESMITLKPWHPQNRMDKWIDLQIENLYAKQMDTGWLDQNYLEGNFVRTALLYAESKTQGVALEPWRKDLAWGSTNDVGNNDLYIYLHSKTRWSGALRINSLRHQRFLRLPRNYPRLNSSPEWIEIQPDRAYEIVFRTETREVSGDDLIKGIPLSLEAGNAINVRISFKK
jgi:hypothetical protein